mmetsp:Transcript_6984/g.16110  ORF Transcript_6984/g.16110 Transcript_6984/m.16110 type:complete len:1060 (-) Transcript_6984:1411-4590(-)
MHVTILYGSETGNAESIAKDLGKSINEAAKEGGKSEFTTANVFEMNQFKRKKLMETWAASPANGMARHALIVVCSTTGNGDAPENAGRFIRFIKKPVPESLSKGCADPTKPLTNVAYATLGLGDTNYDQFCASGKLLDRKLNEWGAVRALPLVCADEATGLDSAVEPFLDSVLDGLAHACDSGERKDEVDDALGGGVAAVSLTQDEEADPKPDIGRESECSAAIDEEKGSGSPSEGLANESNGTSSSKPKTEQSTSTSAASKSASPLYILYGSATGNAEHIAKDLAKTYETYLSNPSFLGYFTSVQCCELNKYKKNCLDTWSSSPDSNNLQKVKHGIIIVCSTTGNADAPENADRFVRWIKRKTTKGDTFQHCAYAVLGLGDTNYDVFCAMGKVIDKRLEELGGTRAVSLGMADEATGLEEVVEPWVGNVISELAEVCKGHTSIGSLNQGMRLPETNKRPIRSSSPTDEEKKMEDGDLVPFNSRSTGVRTIRALMSIPITDPLPDVPNSELPTMVSSLSSCRLIDETTRDRSESLAAENMTVSSASSGFLFTASRPYESKILNARYLTKTNTACAAKVAEVLDSGDGKLVEALDMYSHHFPLSEDKNGKRVIEMTMSLPDDFTLEYEPGDSVGMIVPNSHDSVGFVLEMLLRNHGIQRSQRISVDEGDPVTVEEALRTTVDLSGPMKKKRLLLLANFAKDAEEERALRLLSRASKPGEPDLYDTFVEQQRRSVVDILHEFPSAQSISLEGLLGCLTAIPPRYYSVCSSPLKDRQDGNECQVKVAFSVVDFNTPVVQCDVTSGRRVRGLATSRLECVSSPFLSGRQPSAHATLLIFPKPTHEFRLPADISTPLVLIGPGTGIAPFIGFLSHRLAQIASLESTEAAHVASEGTWRGSYELNPDELNISKSDVKGLNVAADYLCKQKTGDVDLFFGCRHSDHDYLYQHELERFRDVGLISNLYTAFSRDDKEHKTYVQTLMLTDETCGKRLVEMITKKQASVYICGDGNAMGRDVQNAIVSLLAKDLMDSGKCETAEQAKSGGIAKIDQMKSFGKFVLDIWS